MNLLRQDPMEFAKREKMGIVHIAYVGRPSVISTNMLVSSMSVIEFLNKLQPFREETPKNYAKVMMDF